MAQGLGHSARRPQPFLMIAACAFVVMVLAVSTATAWASRMSRRWPRERKAGDGVSDVADRGRCAARDTRAPGSSTARRASRTSRLPLRARCSFRPPAQAERLAPDRSRGPTGRPGSSHVRADTQARASCRPFEGVDLFASKGYVVVAPDYPGLGSSGDHPYLIGESAAHAVLDSVRAARSIEEARAGDRFIVWGHSQGGHAALFTGMHAHAYAPELKLAGVAAAAPVSRPFDVLSMDTDPFSGRLFSALLYYRMVAPVRLPAFQVRERRTRWRRSRRSGRAACNLPKISRRSRPTKARSKRTSSNPIRSKTRSSWVSWPRTRLAPCRRGCPCSWPRARTTIP